jgi:hypothetical protein
VVTAEMLNERRAIVASSADLQRLLAHLRERARPLLERMPLIPEHKALLSIDGGVCPDDGAALTFDPWSATEHRCPRCGKTWRGHRHDAYWARFQHLWLVERAAHLATIAALGDQDDCTAANRASEILATYGERYWRYPNRDNVLGPSRLFFSTYLESIWTSNYLAAAMTLRTAGLLDEGTTKLVNQVAEEAATLIGDYDEGFSNRQTWNNTALTAVAVWFEDEELAQRALEGDTGLVAHLGRGFGRDGMWFEGENYHLFAVRGLLAGVAWARLAGLDFWSDERLAPRIAAALRAPTLTALPDFTFPARKDSRFGLSLAQPAFLELWEIGLAGLTSSGLGAELGDELTSWLAALYALPPSRPERLDYYLHDFGVPAAKGGRSSLSWWSLLEILPALPPVETPRQPKSVLLETQGLAVLRRADRYVSLETRSAGGGHGHPDQLHLTLFADGVYWLPDPGTGDYVTRDLFWYRSPLAHNAPQLVGEPPADDTRCECFAEESDWAWVRGRSGTVSRTVVTGPSYIVDVVELSAHEEHLVELPWHFAGAGDIETRGHWTAADDVTVEFVTRVERFVTEASGPLVLQQTADGAQLTAHVLFEGDLFQAEGPPLPGQTERAAFYLIRARGRNLRIVTILEPHAAQAAVRTVRIRGEAVEVETTAGIDRHRPGSADWTIETASAPPVVLRGARETPPPFKSMVEIDLPTPVTAAAFRVGTPPALDGTLEGFEQAEPLQLTLEDQYRRSEDAYPGPDELSAIAYAAWDESALYLAVEVSKPDLCLRPHDAAPLLLDNEPDDIHSDGLQLYIASARATNGASDAVGYLVVPESNGRGIRASVTSDTRGIATPSAVRGGWQRMEQGGGYRVTLAIPWPPAEGLRPHAGAHAHFDLIVNELLPGRMRRSGQLVWSGGNGWVWLRGDRQDPSRFGVLELVG